MSASSSAINSGDLTAACRTWANAQAFASLNYKYLDLHGINAVVMGITLDARKHTVLIRVSANLDRLFPSLVPAVVVSESEFAEIRAFTH